MKTDLFAILAAAVALPQLALQVHAQQKTHPLHEDGYVLNWLVLLPVPLADDEQGAAALDSKKVKDVVKASPKANDKVTIDGEALTWNAQEADDEGKLDFNSIHGEQVEDCAAFALAYVIADAEIKGAQAVLGSDDQCILFVNGKEVFRFEEPRPYTPDEDVSDSFTLKQGVNTLLFVVVNEKIGFEGSVKLVDDKENPLTKKVKVSLTPP